MIFVEVVVGDWYLDGWFSSPACKLENSQIVIERCASFPFSSYWRFYDFAHLRLIGFVCYIMLPSLLAKLFILACFVQKFLRLEKLIKFNFWISTTLTFVGYTGHAFEILTPGYWTAKLHAYGHGDASSGQFYRCSCSGTFFDVL